MIVFFKFTKDEVFQLKEDDSQNLYWYVDSAFNVHRDMRSHTGSIFILRVGSISSSSLRKKVNTRSYTGT